MPTNQDIAREATSYEGDLSQSGQNIPMCNIFVKNVLVKAGYNAQDYSDDTHEFFPFGIGKQCQDLQDIHGMQAGQIVGFYRILTPVLTLSHVMVALGNDWVVGTNNGSTFGMDLRAMIGTYHLVNDVSSWNTVSNHIETENNEHGKFYVSVAEANDLKLSLRVISEE